MSHTAELTSDELIHLKAKERIAELERMAEDQEKYIESQRRRINKHHRQIHDLRAELKRKTDEADDLRGELKRIKDSVVWLDPASVSAAVSADCEITGVKTAADRNRELLKSAVDLTAHPMGYNQMCMQCNKEFAAGWIPGHNVTCPDCGSIWPHVVGLPVYRSVGM